MRFAVVVLSVLLLTGCVGSDPPVTPAPTPSSTPLFASDADALKAAEAAYKRFNDVADQILHEGGANPDRLRAVATGALLKANLKDFHTYRSKGYTAVGTVQRTGFQLQQRSNSHTDTVTIYVCEDVSGVDVVDRTGTSVVSSSRPPRQKMAMSFDARASGALIASSKSAWSDAC